MADVIAAFTAMNPLEKVGVLAFAVVGFRILGNYILPFLWSLMRPAPPKVVVPIEEEEAKDTLVGYPKFNPSQLKGEQKRVFLWDPSTYDYFGEVPAMSEKQVKDIVASARVAQEQWKQSSFAKRELLMRTMQRYITENMETCARVAVRDSGKTLLDAIIGEVLLYSFLTFHLFEEDMPIMLSSAPSHLFLTNLSLDL
jgi:hypothetical protein